MAKKAARKIPLSQLIVVACAGLVGFLALWQAFFAFVGYKPCILHTSYTTPNPNVAITELGIAIVALYLLFWGARRLRQNFPEGFLGYSLVVASLLIGEGLLIFIFLQQSACAS